jgi:uncharacterized DUF497 family protein
MFAGIPTEEMLDLLKTISKDDFHKKLKGQGIPLDRINIFHAIISGKQRIEYPDNWDIQRFALKTFFSDKYKEMSLGDHCYSKGELCEYDPPKNGANIIKHGISFLETISYSRSFGSLIVTCPDKDDLERSVIFSGLDLTKYKLQLPLESFRNETDLCTLSIVQTRETRFRLISTRIMSKSKYRESMDQAFRNIYANNKIMKSDFVNRCVEIIENTLLK